MRLTKDNIKFVKVLTKNGVPYSWGVVMKSNRVCDNRHYCNFDERGRSTADPYPMERLPITVRRYLVGKEVVEFSSYSEGIIEYIVR